MVGSKSCNSNQPDTPPTFKYSNTSFSHNSKDRRGVSLCYGSFYFHGGYYYHKFIAGKVDKTLKIEVKSIKDMYIRLSGGNGDIRLDDFDLCLVIGGFFYLPVGKMAEIAAKSSTLYSRQVVEAATRDLFERIHVNALVKTVREISDIPMYLIHDPFQAHKQDWTVDDMVVPFEAYDYEKGVQLLNQIELNPQSVTLLAQPAETIEAPYYTKREYSVLRRKPYQREIDAGKTGDFVDDFKHMNAEYGALCFKAFFEGIGITPRSAKML